MLEVIPTGEAHLWYVSPRRVSEGTLSSYVTQLAGLERSRHQRFAKKVHAHEYAVTRALACVALTSYLGAPPRFELGPNGKPHLSPVAQIDFNLSNCAGLVVCLVGPTDVGVDVEEWTRAEEVIDAADTVLSSREHAVLGTLSPADRGAYCLRAWTAKEAYVKARGLGLSLPVDRITVNGLDLSFEDPIEDDARDWVLAAHEIEGCLVATVVRSRTPIRVIVREATL